MCNHPADEKSARPAVVKPSWLKYILYWGVFAVTYGLSICYIMSFLGHLYEHSEFNVIVTLAYCVMALLFLFGVDRRKWSVNFHNENKALNLILVLVPAVTACLDVFKDGLLKFYTNHYWAMCLALTLIFAAFGLVLIFGLNRIFIRLEKKYPEYLSK